jgi:hypothetical protein
MTERAGDVVRDFAASGLLGGAELRQSAKQLVEPVAVDPVGAALDL